MTLTTTKRQTDGSERQKITCQLCFRRYHRLDVHLKSAHSINVKQYRDQFPHAETISDWARQRASAGQQRRADSDSPQIEPPRPSVGDESQKPLLFGRIALDQRRGLPDAELALVPPHDPNWICGEREKDQLESIALGAEQNTPVFVFGPAGCGKTTLFERLAALVGQPTIRIQLNQRFTADEFVGKIELELDSDTGQQVTTWKDGALTSAMRYGRWLLLDEITAAPAGVMMKLQAVLEGRSLILTENNGEIVKPHPHFRIFASDNTNGRGDGTGLYAGTNVLNEATMDRFGVVLEADYPGRDDEIRILVARTGVKSDLAKRMVSVAHKVRAAIRAEECYGSLGTRRLILWAAATQRLGDARKAAKITLLGKMGQDDRVFVEGLIQRYFGGEVAL